MRAFIKGFPKSGALGHEGVAESYAAGDEQPARAKRGQRPVPAGPGVETGIPAQRPGFAPERFGGDFVSLPAFSGAKLWQLLSEGAPQGEFLALFICITIKKTK